MITMIGKVLMGMGMKALTSSMIEWVIMELAEMLVKRTKTKFDDRWLSRLKSEMKK